MSDPAYEQRDIHVRAVVYFLSALVLGVALVALVVATMLHFLSADSPIRANFAARPTQQPAGPDVQANQPANLAQYREEQTRLLTTAGWQDPERTIARVPIEAAMQFVFNHGADLGPGATLSQPQTPVEIQRLKASPTPSPTP